jgi:hypothetical protein
MILAVLMINPVSQWLLRLGQYPQAVLDGGHTVGAPDGGPGLPVTNWSLQAGDLRAPHFVGIHALQLLPLLAWLLGRRARGRGSGRQVGLVHVAGVAYLGLVVLLGWQALRGEPVTRPGAATLAAAGVLLLAGVGAAVAVMIGTGYGGASRPARAPGPGAPEPLEPAPAAPTGPRSLHGQSAATTQPPQADRAPPDA